MTRSKTLFAALSLLPMLLLSVHPAAAEKPYGMWQRNDTESTCGVKKQYNDAKYALDDRELKFDISKSSRNYPATSFQRGYFKLGKSRLKRTKARKFSLYGDGNFIGTLERGELEFGLSLDDQDRAMFGKIAASSVLELRDGEKVIETWEIGDAAPHLARLMTCPVLTDEQILANYDRAHPPEEQARERAERGAELAEARARREERASNRQADNAAAMGIMLNTLQSAGPQRYQALPSAPSYTPNYQSRGASTGGSSSGSVRQNCGSAKYGCGVNGKGEMVDAKGNVYGKANDPYTGQSYKARSPQAQESRCKEYVYYTDGTRHCKAQPSTAIR